MRIIRISFAFVALLGLAVAGCSDDDTNPVNHISVFSMANFPMDIGVTWKYSVHDTVADTYDTVDVVVSDTTRFPDNHFCAVWLYSGVNYISSRDNVSIFGDTLKFFRDRSSVADRYLVFPIELGNGWGFNYSAGHDTDFVDAKEIVDIPYGQMAAYRIRSITAPLALDVIRFSNIWITEDVGIVRAEYASGFRVVEHYEIWELIEFQSSR
jgi:hypothetical protein